MRLPLGRLEDALDQVLIRYLGVFQEKVKLSKVRLKARVGLGRGHRAVHVHGHRPEGLADARAT